MFVAVVRPDWYVYGTASHVHELTAVLEQLAQALQRQPVAYFTMKPGRPGRYPLGRDETAAGCRLSLAVDLPTATARRDA